MISEGYTLVIKKSAVTNNCRKLILHIEANNPINLFNTTWYIIEISPELVKLVVETPDQRIEFRLVR